MAPRAFWKGYLKLSLVTCPVSMQPATSENEKVRFHTVNKATGNRVKSRYVDTVTGKPVADKDEIKGYAVAEDRYVTLTDEELEAVALETTRTIDIESFVPRDSVAWIWLDKPHYLAPDDKVGEEAFSVIRDAMAASKMVAISRVVLYRRERPVMIEPRDNGLILWTLRYADEVRDAKEYFAGVEGTKPDAKLLPLIKSLIDEKSRDWSPDLVEDPVQDRLLEIIAAKKRKGGARPKAVPKEEVVETAGNVISIMDALRKSLANEKKDKGGK